MSPDAVPHRVRRILSIVAIGAIATGGAAFQLRSRLWSSDRDFEYSTTREGGVERTRVTGHDVDVTELPFARALGLTGHATIDGDVRVKLVDDRLDYRGATGTVAASCRDCVVDFDPHVEALGNLRFGPITIERLDARFVAGAGHLNLEAWKLVSRDVRVEASLDVELAEHLDDSRVTGCLRFAATDSLVQRDPKLAALLSATGAVLGSDGLYNIRLSGTVGDTKRLAQVCDGSQNTPRETTVIETHDGGHEVAKAELDRILADPMMLAKSARIVPTMADGKPIGFKVYAIKPGSLFAQAGLHNGDTLVAFDGFDLTTPDKALEVYVKLRSAAPPTSHTLSIVRGGNAMDLRYVVVP